MLTCILSHLEPPNRCVCFPLPSCWACPAAVGSISHRLSFQKCCWHLQRAGRNTDGQMPWEGFQSCQPHPHKGSRPLERSVTGMQACWSQVLYGTSLPEAQLWETLPATLLPQCVFEYFTLSNFGKSLIAEEEFYLANVNCIYLGKGKK